MICGNKSTLGNAVLQGLTFESTKILTENEVKDLKESGRMMIELWNE